MLRRYDLMPNDAAARIASRCFDGLISPRMTPKSPISAFIIVDMKSQPRYRAGEAIEAAPGTARRSADLMAHAIFKIRAAPI